MPRNPRVHVPGGVYHAILRGNHRQVIFSEDPDYQRFEGILRESLQRYGALLHAYCWMPNHVHLAIEVGEAPLGRVMQLVASRYARSKQRRVPTTGHLFERRYRAKLVDADRYLLTLVRYIHNNPVRAGLVADAADHEWSSHLAYLGRVRTEWLVTSLALGALGEHPPVAMAAYRPFMANEPDADELRHIRPPIGRGKAATPTRPPAIRPVRPRRAQPRRSLEDIVVEVARESGVNPTQLNSGRRFSWLVRARTEIARRALLEGAATLTQVATRLGRTPSSLSELLARQAQIGLLLVPLTLGLER